jgi:DNA-binding PadR family transcriptional regulator
MREQSSGFVILGVLAIGGELSGYDIRQWIEQAVGFFWRESFGQIYPELRRLAAAGLVKIATESASGRKTKRYRITAKGREELRRWLERAPRPERPRIELLLKLFFGEVTGPGAASALLRNAQATYGERAKALAAAEGLVIADDRASPNLVYALITVLSGRLVYAARLEWARASLALLEAAENGNEAVLRTYAKVKRQITLGEG